MSRINVPLENESISWRRFKFFDMASTCEHVEQAVFSTKRHTIIICNDCGDPQSRECNHKFSWIKQSPPFVDEFGTLFDELLLCEWCGLDGT